MSNVIQLVPNQKPDPFCSLLLRVTKIANNPDVIRLKEPIALILGLDELTVDYIGSLFRHFAKLRDDPRSGLLLDEITWHDNMPAVAVGASDPVVCDLIGQLIDQPAVIHPGYAPCRQVVYQDMELCIDKSGVSWNFHVEGSLYNSEAMPQSVFRIAQERYGKRDD